MCLFIFIKTVAQNKFSVFEEEIVISFLALPNWSSWSYMVALVTISLICSSFFFQIGNNDLAIRT